MGRVGVQPHKVVLGQWMAFGNGAVHTSHCHEPHTDKDFGQESERWCIELMLRFHLGRLLTDEVFASV